MSRPRILYVSPPWPYRSIRSLHIARALQRFGEVEVVVVDSVCGDQPSVDVLGRELKLAYELPVPAPVPTGVFTKIRSRLDPRAPFPHGIGVDPVSEQRLRETLKSYDLVWIFKLRTANMFRFQQWPCSVLDIDDLPSGVCQTVAESHTVARERRRARGQMAQWQRREGLLGERFSVLTVCSEADRRKLKTDAPVHVIPSGFDPPPHGLSRQPSSPPRLGFIGLFDYEPNIEGVRWFIQHCWPEVKRRIPDARLRLVGRGSEAVFGGLSPDIETLGWVEDADREISGWSAMIVPLLVGGGTRVKIAEGFSRKCPIVATSLGAFGYEVESPRDLLLADQPGDFAGACVRLIEEPGMAVEMAERAYARYLQLWTWEAIAPRIWKAAEDALTRR